MKNWDLVNIFEKVNNTKISKNSILKENKQLADKLYFNTGKLTPEDKETILAITNGDNYTKFIADCLYYMKDKLNFHDEKIQKKLKELYPQISTYNKNVFPIKGLNADINKINGGMFIYSLEYRNEIIETFKELPSIANRNLKSEIRQERNDNELKNYLDKLKYFSGQISLLSNRDPKTQNIIFQKMFKSGATLDQLIDFTEEKENLLGGKKVSRKMIIDVVNDNNYDMSIVYEEGMIMVVKVESPQAIKNIGCTSLWCFTYGNGFDNAYRQWNNYSTNDIVYVVIDFSEDSNSLDFMHVVIKPLDWSEDLDTYHDAYYDDEGINNEKVFNMGNESLGTPLKFLDSVFGLEKAKNIFTFDMEEN